MDKDKAVIFCLPKLTKTKDFLTPDDIYILMNCRNCQGKYGRVTSVIMIRNEMFNLCSECSKKVCILCSPTNNFKTSNFICPNNHLH